MKPKTLCVSPIDFETLKNLKAGERILLTGTIYTARDAAHKRLHNLMQQSAVLPFELKDAAIYYAGPTPAKKSQIVGAIGPTTSARMDVFTPELLKNGVKITIGKGDRAPEVALACKEYGSIYLCALGGAGALYSKCVKSCEVVAFDDLGCESIKKLQVQDFPLIVGIDYFGNAFQ